MKKVWWYIGICIIGTMVPQTFMAQDVNDNAGVTTESVEDEFQDHFFEALRERAIENYGKAVDALLKCKELNAEDPAVDYQLGINYADAGLWEESENYLLTAVEKDPDNRWYAEALYETYKVQGKTQEAITIAENLAKSNVAFEKSLVYLYEQNMDYGKAIAQIDKLDDLYGNDEYRNDKRKKLLAKQKHQTYMEHDVEVIEAEAEPEETEDNPLEILQNYMTDLLAKGQYEKLKEKSQEALDSYPAQPGFYYMNGLALQHLEKYKDAVSMLEMGLDYLIDDIVLEKKIYEALAQCHKKLGNVQKEQEYLQKVKNI